MPYRLRLTRRQCASAKKTAIRTVEIFIIDLSLPHEKAAMATTYAMFKPTVRRQVEIRIKVTHRIGPPDEGLRDCR